MSSLPPIRVVHPHVEASDDLLAGSPVVRGTQVPVRRLFAWHRRGTSVETLVKRYPRLGWAKVLGALSFAYDNLDVMEADLLRERELLEASTPDGSRQAAFAFGAPDGAPPRGRRLQSLSLLRRRRGRAARRLR